MLDYKHMFIITCLTPCCYIEVLEDNNDEEEEAQILMKKQTGDHISWVTAAVYYSL